MSDLDLRPFVSRFRALVDSSTPQTLEETRAWIVGPLLEALGWDVTDDSCRTDVTVDETRLEYVCLAETVPVLFVAVDPVSSPLDRDRASAVYQTMAWTGVDRAIYTNGRQALLLAGTSDVEHCQCRLSRAVDHEPAFDHFTRDALERRVERHERDYVARQLALERDALADAIIDRLTAATDETYEREFAAATGRFLDGLVASFASGGTALPAADETSDPDDGISIRFSDPTASTTAAADPTDETDETDATDRPAAAGDVTDRSDGDADTPDATDASDDATAATDTDRSVGAATDETDGEPDEERTTTPDADAEPTPDPEASADADGEYVVRFFAERGSIGAIGHSTSTKALVHAAEYCLDRGLAGVSVPWSPSDGDETVLNDEPVHADGTPMAAVERLSNGLYLNTGGTAADRATRVEELASRSGLRAMLTGDWDRDT